MMNPTPFSRIFSDDDMDTSSSSCSSVSGKKKKSPINDFQLLQGSIKKSEGAKIV